MFLPTQSTGRQAFRDHLFTTLPILKQEPRYLAFVLYLLFDDNYDPFTLRHLIPRRTLVTIDDQYRQYQNHRYSGQDFLQEIKTHVLPDLRWSGWEYDCSGGVGKARTILNDGLPSSLLARAHDERKTFSRSDERVLLFNGMVYNRARQAQRRVEEQQQAFAASMEVALPEVRDLLTYMNTRKSNLFTSLLAYAPLAEAALQSIEKPTKQQTIAFRKSQLNTLRRFQEQPQPFYRLSASGRSTRIFACGGGLLNLKGVARKRMTSTAHWLECDLKSAHLAIIARDWGIPAIYTYLREGKDIWADLLTYAGLDYTDENKAQLKDMLYAIIYGAAAAWVQGTITRRFDDPIVGQQVRSHPIIAALIERRDAMKNRVVESSGMRDCFGRWHALADMEGDIETRAFGILSICAQARELQLLTPVIREAIHVDQAGRAWQIVLFQHDGFTIAVRDDRMNRVKGIIRRLQALVQAKADELDIPTWLACDTD